MGSQVKLCGRPSVDANPYKQALRYQCLVLSFGIVQMRSQGRFNGRQSVDVNLINVFLAPGINAWFCRLALFRWDPKGGWIVNQVLMLISINGLLGINAFLSFSVVQMRSQGRSNGRPSVDANPYKWALVYQCLVLSFVIVQMGSQGRLNGRPIVDANSY